MPWCFWRRRRRETLNSGIIAIAMVRAHVWNERIAILFNNFIPEEILKLVASPYHNHQALSSKQVMRIL